MRSFGRSLTGWPAIIIGTDVSISTYGIKPLIVIEEYLKDQDGNAPFNYKCYCFNGVPDQILVRSHIQDSTQDIWPIFDTTWNLIEVTYKEKGAGVAKVY